MRIVELLPGLRTSALGFGCAPILGSVDAGTARIALTAALDAGITHFDLARSYGYGQAERFVGAFLRSRRHEVTIATKFGIEATALAALLAPAKPLLRRLRRGGGIPAPAAAPTVPVAPAATAGGRLADLLHRRRSITPERLQQSLEISLRELGTDYVDFLFIHEPLSPVAGIEDLLAAAARLCAEGKVRAFGLAFMVSQSPLHVAYRDRFAVLQFDNSPGAPHYAETVADRATQPNLFFSPFRHRGPGDEPTEILRRLGRDFPNSVTLASMFRPCHIRANAAACE